MVVSHTRREYEAEALEYGAEGSLGRKGVWGGREYGAEGSLGRKGVWGGREYGSEGILRRMGALGGPTYRRGFQPALAPKFFVENGDASRGRKT